MLQKYGRHALFRIDHCQLHLDFDNRENSPWNHDIINLFPTDHPVEMTSWKGIVYVHYLNEEPVDCNCKGTREIMEMIYVPWGEWKPKLRQLNCPCCMGVKVMPDGEELLVRIPGEGTEEMINRKDEYKSNPDIDISRIRYDYHVKYPTDSYRNMILKRIVKL